MSFILDQYPVKGGNRYNATNKARADVTKILENIGFCPINIYIRQFKIPFVRAITALPYYIRLLTIKKGEELYIQYPIGFNYSVFYYVIKVLKFKRVSVSFIVHDLDYLRYPISERIKCIILKPLRLADKIVVHTTAMKDTLKRENIDTKFAILNLFDYLTTDSYSDMSLDEETLSTIVFAGNLKKSLFLPELNSYQFDYVKFHFYGMNGNMTFGHGKKYIGAFKPENVSFIKGGWGLVWDGDSITTCSGLMGNYLKYNASHKISLYIAAGIPVIVWTYSGVADWILQQGIGICIDSLEKLDEALKGIDLDTYNSIRKRVLKLSELLRKGQMLLNAIKE